MGEEERPVPGVMNDDDVFCHFMDVDGMCSGEPVEGRIYKAIGRTRPEACCWHHRFEVGWFGLSEISFEEWVVLDVMGS